MKHTTKLLSIIAVTCLLLGLMGCQPTTGNIGCSHSWDKGVIKTEATCTTNGLKLYTCEICGVTKDETIPAHHTWVIDTNATCTTKGAKDCSVCGTHEEISVIGHNFNATTSICSVCGKHEHCECVGQTTFCDNDFVVYICSDKENPDNPDLTVTKVFCIIKDKKILSKELETLVGGKVLEFMVEGGEWRAFDDMRVSEDSIDSPIYVFLE